MRYFVNLFNIVSELFAILEIVVKLLISYKVCVKCVNKLSHCIFLFVINKLLYCVQTVTRICNTDRGCKADRRFCSPVLFQDSPQ